MMVTVSAEGRIENQKVNQTIALSLGWVCGFQLNSPEKHLITLAAVTFSFENFEPQPQIDILIWNP